MIHIPEHSVDVFMLHNISPAPTEERHLSCMICFPAYNRIETVLVRLDNTMSDHDSLQSRVEKLSLNHKTPIATLDEVLQSVKRQIEHASATLHQVNTLFTSKGAHRDESALDLPQIDLLCRTAKETVELSHDLAELTESVERTAEEAIIMYLRSIGLRNTSLVQHQAIIQSMLTHFDDDIRAIVRGFRGASEDGTCTMWRVVEERYKQACDYGSDLHASDYNSMMDETALELPYDPDYDTENYYEHENSLLVDEDYAEDHHERQERAYETRKRNEQDWVSFWLDVLHACPKGPTLFRQPRSRGVNITPLARWDIPRYLFRTFDEESSGVILKP